MGKPLYKWFQLSFPVLYENLVKTNENQPIITTKFNPTFREKVTTDCSKPEKTLAGNKDSLSDITRALL